MKKIILFAMCVLFVSACTSKVATVEDIAKWEVSVSVIDAGADASIECVWR
jgi:hypothetical protein